MIGMRARGRPVGAGVGLDRDQGLEAGGGGQDQGASLGQREDLGPRKGQDLTPGILMKSQKVAQGADRSPEVVQRAETRRKAAQSRVQDPGPDHAIKRLFGNVGKHLLEFSL